MLVSGVWQSNLVIYIYIYIPFLILFHYSLLQDVEYSSFCVHAQLCLTLCDPMDCSLPGSSVHGILQARILEQVAISFSRGSSWPRDRTQVSCIAGRFFTVWATREAQFTSKYLKICLDGENYKTLLKDIKEDQNRVVHYPLTITLNIVRFKILPKIWAFFGFCL